MAFQLHLLQLSAIVASSLLLGCVHQLSADEPAYQARTLSSWMQDFAIGRHPDMEKHHAAVRAVRAIGVEAVPILTEKLRTTSHSTDIVQDIYLISAFEALGTKARPAIPALIELLAPSYDAARESLSEPDAQLNDRISINAALALRAIGRYSVSPLIEALNADDVKIRFGAAMALENFSRHSNRVVPALIKALEDKDCDVRWCAAASIGKLRAKPSLSVPALVKRLRDDPSMNVRCYAIMAIGKFGSTATISIPDLRNAATDSTDSAIRSYAQTALKEIERATAEKPGE